MASVQPSFRVLTRFCLTWFTCHWMAATAAPVSIAAAGYPRLIGMAIGEKNYADHAVQAQLARMDIVILGFYRGWGGTQSARPMRAAVQAIKQLHPGVLIGQYTVLNEANDDRSNTADADKQAVLSARHWWLRDAAGRRQQWTSAYGAWDINLTDSAQPDGEGRRYPQWLAQRDHATYFAPVPEFDIWYFDNVMQRPRIARADWRGEGVDQDGGSAAIGQAFRQAQVQHWDAAHALAPTVMSMGNPDNDLSSAEYRGQLQAAFLEEMMGTPTSLHARLGWQAVMQRYRTVAANLALPAIVGFHAAGDPHDLRLLRFSLATCLMGDAYFSFTDIRKGYRDIPWFDEYDALLGRPLDPPQAAAWRDGVFRRRFSNGMALVNPSDVERRVPIEAGYRHLEGRQTRQINSGARTNLVVLPPNDGILLRKTHM